MRVTAQEGRTRRGAIPRRALLTAFVGFAFASASGSARAAALPARLRELLTQFQSCPGLEAQFSEEKNIVLLSAPLRSSGKIYFRPPQSLARITDKPRVSHVVVNDQKIVVKEDKVRKEIDFSDKPALAGLIGSLLRVLAGDAERLAADYSAEFSEEGTVGWRLRLVPKKADLARLIEALTFLGKDLKLSELRVKEANGDETVTRFSNVNEKRKFTPAEVKQYFEI
jgi:outer membrane lipoprotein-sorting protein